MVAGRRRLTRDSRNRRLTRDSRIPDFSRKNLFLYRKIDPWQPGEAVRTRGNRKNTTFFQPKNVHPYIKSNSALFDHLNPPK